MTRDLPHFHLKNIGTTEPFQARIGGGGKRPSDVPNRAAHAQALLTAIDGLQAAARGVYLEVSGRPDERLKIDSLDSSGLKLLHFDDGAKSETNQQSATVFATQTGIVKLRKKVDQFRTENTADKEKNNEIVPGRPKNADLVQSIAAITEAGLRALWRSPSGVFPHDNAQAAWEIWLDPDLAEDFVAGAPRFGIIIAPERLEFPEDIVVIAQADHNALAGIVRMTGSVKALAAPSVTADYFDGLPVQEQAEWVDDLAQRTHYGGSVDPNYITLLDTGVNRAHPLIQPSLSVDDRHAADPAWGLDDIKGHGTLMAGLALYGDLTHALQVMSPITVNHRLESVKLLPDASVNPHHLLGALTRTAVDTVEVYNPRRRTFVMATTTGEDTPHDGAPTSWSSEIDQLAAGVSGNSNVKRLMLISAGNIENNKFSASHYLETCDDGDSEIESPAQAWNALCVGAYTEKTLLPQEESQTALAPAGDLSPTSRTASWASHWPIKPDVVFEGGNWINSALPPPLGHGWLSLLSTHHQYPQRSFNFAADTSAATALAAKAVTELWLDYPTLQPETIRGLLVSSARWTPQMMSHLPANPNKGSYASLFTRYGYGVPDLVRARRSASNALTLIVEDTITPYELSKNSGGPVIKEMKLFTLPWPVEALRALNDATVTLRVTLSTFIAPNPSEAARGTKYGYASHNLRFKLNKPDESVAQFMYRISKLAAKPDGPQISADDGWQYGQDRRDVGSLQIDQLTGRASDLARRNMIAVHPISGWWKSKSVLKEGLPEARFSLIIEIDTDQLDAQLYAEVSAAIENTIAAQTVITV